MTPGSSSKPYILFLHGFPSSAYDWRHQISYFSQNGYGIIAPVCLGYGETSKPLDVEAYKGKKMASEIIAILDRLNISKVMGVGHDWYIHPCWKRLFRCHRLTQVARGSSILSRMANYYPERFLKYAFVDIGYTPPGVSLTPDLLNHIDTLTKEHCGWECFGYEYLYQNE